MPVDKVVAVKKVVNNKAQQQTTQVLQRQLEKQEAVNAKMEVRKKELQAEVKKMSEEVDHRELLLRKHGISDFSLNQRMTKLPLPKADQAQQTEKQKVEVKSEEVPKREKKEEEKQEEGTVPSSSDKKGKKMPYLSKHESRTLKRRGLFFHSEQ